MDNSGGGGRLNRNNKFVATNLSQKSPNFCSKNSLKNQTISKPKTYKFLLKNQSFLNDKSYKILIKSRYFTNYKNINFYNYLSNNQVKNIAHTHFGNLKNINLKIIKSYYKNLHYNLIKRRHTISGLFRIYCQRLNTKFLYNQYNLSKIPKHNTFVKGFLPKLQE